MRKELCLAPLAFGTFGLGMTEFVMMGILPDAAQDMNVSIPDAGNFISFYALGVVFGAILLVLIGRTKPLKTILLWLMSVFTFANLLMVFVPDYYIFCIVRFIAGLPHGAFFGVGAITAGKLAGKSRNNQAVATMVAGMTCANLVGIPVGTFISHNFSWRITFLLIGLFGLFVIYSISKLVPKIKPLPDSGFRGQFKFLKSLSPWLLIIAVMAGNGGIFCWYSYVSPFFTTCSNIAVKNISYIMILAGLGMCFGNYLGGKLSDKFTPEKIAAYTQLCACVSLVLIFFLCKSAPVSIFLMCIITACLFAIGAPQQVLLIKCAKGGEILGASLSQISFNLGNAIGAHAGAIPLKFQAGYEYSALIGAIFTLLGFFMLYYFQKREFDKKG